MNIELLRTFLEVERLRHFGRAAEGLCVTQAAVSARIKVLEEQLGVKLFDRAGRDIQLTPAGHRLRIHADSLVSGWRKARQNVAMGETGEQIAIGGSLRLWDVFLQGWLHRVRQTYPACSIIAESHTPEVLTRKLLDGSLDVAVMLEPAQLEVLQIEQIGELALVLVSNKAGVKVESALGAGYIFVNWGIAHGVQHTRYFPYAIPAATRVSHASMALELVCHLGGAAYLPETMVAQELADRRLHRVADAPGFRHPVFSAFRMRNAQIELIHRCLELFAK